MKASTPPDKLQEVLQRLESEKEMFSSPFLQFAVMFLTVFLIGIVITVISSLILQRTNAKTKVAGCLTFNQIIMKIIKWSTLITATFCIGWIYGSTARLSLQKFQTMKRVTSIGGIFFKCKNPAAIREWYGKHLGLNTDQYGTNFEWRQAADSSRKGFTQWGPFNQNTKYFDPSEKDFMINYRVDNLVSLVEALKKEGVTVTDEIQSFEYGKFVHILDIEGNKIGLWEPDDTEYEKIVQGRTK